MNGERRKARWLAVAVPAAFLAAAFPAAAGATDYCVAPNTGCGGTNVASFEQALDLADNAADADRIFLGAATYTAPTTSGYNYSQSYPVEIIGRGIGQTILTSPAGASRVFSFYSSAGSWLHDLTIRLPQNAANGHVGLDTSQTARRIEVVEDPVQANYRYGVGLAEWGATLEDSTVRLSGAQQTTAVHFGLPGATVRRSALSAKTGVWSVGGTVARSRMTVTEAGVAAIRGATTLDSSVVHLTEGNSVGIYASAASGSHTTLKANGVTMVGPGLPNTDGAEVFTNFAPAENVDLSLTNSIIRGFEHPLWAYSAGSGQARIAVSYSDYNPSGNTTSGANASITQSNVSNVGNAGFVNAAGGDYHLLAGSPLIDRGDPATPQGLDLDGGPLVADGNGDGIARRDMGAFELHPAAGGGQSPGGQTGGTAPPDTQAPLVSGFRAAPSVFAVGRRATARVARVRRGTRFRYTLSEPARMTLRIKRALPGRRSGGRCVRPTRQLEQAKRCTRYRTVGTLRRSGAKGANRIRFSGRIGKRALRAGRYRAVIRATDAAGNRSVRKRARFRVVRG